MGYVLPIMNARHRFALTMLVTLSLFISTPLAGATTQSTTVGGITASYTYHGSLPLTKDPHLRISLDGKVVYNRAVRSSACYDHCSPNEIAGSRYVVHIVRLTKSGLPSVVLDLYSGGAHCCSVEQVYTLKPNSTIVQKAEHNFGDPGVRLVRLGPGGTFDLLSADDAFAYAFTDYAASGLPLEILSFSNDRFHDVTREFPKLIAKDARLWMKAFKSEASSHYQDSVGLVAAWAADEDMLGHSRSVARFLADQAKVGHLNSALSPINPSGERYVIALQAFLRKMHYLR